MEEQLSSRDAGIENDGLVENWSSVSSVSMSVTNQFTLADSRHGLAI